MQGVTGSIPVVSTIQKALKTQGFQRFSLFARILPKSRKMPKGQQKVNNGSTDFGMRKEKRMASIKENRKKGKIISFKFRVFIGRDENGRQQFRTKTWKPDKTTQKRTLEMNSKVRILQFELLSSIISD